MIVSTNEQAAVLAERARHTLIDTGAVTDGPTVQLRDSVASVGDHIVTRRNDRRLRTSNRGWVVNGDLWTVIRTYRDGAVDAHRHSDGATSTLPDDYLAEHCHLGHATTAHRAQGMTVDVCHAAITHNTSHEALYVAATRGRGGDHLWVATDSDRDVDDLPAPEHVLSRILERGDPDRLSAYQSIEESLSEMTGLSRLGQIFEDAARTSTDHWLRQRLTDRGMAEAADDHEWPTLLTTARQAALAGHDVDALIDDAIRMRPMDAAHSTAAILHWRLGVLTDASIPVRARGPLASLPPTDGPAMDVARQAGELIRQRWQQLRTALDRTTGPLLWAPTLGTRPPGSSEFSAWLTAATAVTAYRERYEFADHTEMLGPRPSTARPDAQAAWDHARLQADRYLARRLRHLTDQQLHDLDTRQQAILHNLPGFDHDDLQQARQALARARRARRSDDILEPTTDLDLQVSRLEQVARHHHAWREKANDAADIQRLIHLERAHRHEQRIQGPRATR